MCRRTRVLDTTTDNVPDLHSFRVDGFSNKWLRGTSNGIDLVPDLALNLAADLVPFSYPMGHPTQPCTKGAIYSETIVHVSWRSAQTSISTLRRRFLRCVSASIGTDGCVYPHGDSHGEWGFPMMNPMGIPHGESSLQFESSEEVL